MFLSFEPYLLSVAGFLPIPAQTWGSQPKITNRNINSRVKSDETDASIPNAFEGEQPNHEPRLEAGKPDGQGKENRQQNEELEEDEETVVIRRVGFVFLAYNVEFW